MEDEEGVALVLARATELRLKISDCIEHSSSTAATGGDSSPGDVSEGESSGDEEKTSDEDDEAERLLYIRDAFESLESQLAALQNLRQRQQYEKQMALAEIDCSRKMLLEKIKEYKGKDFEVIHEASAFAGERVEYKSHLLFPPHPISSPLSLVSENGSLSGKPTDLKNDRNSLISSNSKDEVKNSHCRESKHSSNGVIHFIGSVAKIILPIIGVVSVLAVSGYGPEISNRGLSLNLLGLLQPRANGEKRSSVQCPPGKVLVMENGEKRCVVKERFEIPFDSVVAKRDINYGYG